MFNDPADQHAYDLGFAHCVGGISRGANCDYAYALGWNIANEQIKNGTIQKGEPK